MSEFVTTAEASKILCCSLRTIQRYVKKKALKTKIIAGKTLIRKESIEKILPTVNPDKKKENETARPAIEIAYAHQSAKTKSPDTIIPDGYILIDKETLESLRSQIKTLTVSVSDMQLTQKLLIQKGLNLKEVESNTQPYDDTKSNLPKVTRGITHTIPVGTGSTENEFFVTSDITKNSNLALWITLGIASIILIVLIALTFFTSR